MDALGVYSAVSFPQLGPMQLVWAKVATSPNGSPNASISISVDWDLGTIMLSSGEFVWPSGNLVYMLPSTGSFSIPMNTLTVSVNITPTSIGFSNWISRATIACNLFKLMQ